MRGHCPQGQLGAPETGDNTLSSMSFELGDSSSSAKPRSDCQTQELLIQGETLRRREGSREGGSRVVPHPGSGSTTTLIRREGDSKRESCPSTVSPPTESRSMRDSVSDGSSGLQEASWVLVPVLPPIS